MFSFKKVSKLFSPDHGIREISAEIQPQKTTVLIGPSGCGKSTLLRLMIALLTPDRGDVCFLGKPLPQYDRCWLRRQLGYVIQDGGLFPHLTAFENITLAAKHNKMTATAIAKKIETLIELTNFDRNLLQRFPHQLSGGQKQRVSLMRALMLDPQVLLLDEPFAALDPMIRYELIVQLKKIFQDVKKTVVIVTHDIGEAAVLADCVFVINQGTLEQQGSLAHIIGNPATPFVAQFIAAQRNLAEGILVQN